MDINKLLAEKWIDKNGHAQLINNTIHGEPLAKLTANYIRAIRIIYGDLIEVDNIQFNLAREVDNIRRPGWMPVYDKVHNVYKYTADRIAFDTSVIEQEDL